MVCGPMIDSGKQITLAQGGTYSTNYWFTCPEGTIDRGKVSGAVHLRMSWVTVVLALFVYSVSGIEIGEISVTGGFPSFPS